MVLVPSRDSSLVQNTSTMRRTLLLTLLVGLLAPTSFAQVPSLLHYQGRVVEGDSQVEGEHDVTARIFESESGGQALWSEARTDVPITEGRFDLLLGSETAFPASLFDGGARYLEIEVNGEQLPRLRMASTAYALQAGVAASVRPGAVDTEGLAENAAVTNVNGLAGALLFEATGSATLEASGDTLTFGASSGGLSSVDHDGTLTGDGTEESQLGISAGGVGTSQLAESAVTSAIVEDNSLAAVDLIDGAVGAPQLADGAVTASALASGAVTSGAILSEAVGTDEIEDQSITASDLDVVRRAVDGRALTYQSDAPGQLAWRDVDASNSSIRFKTDIETLSDARSIVDQLRGVRFHWKDDDRPDVGLIAEEVEAVLPELVTYESDGATVRGLRYGPLVAVLIEANKAQQEALTAASNVRKEQREELRSLSDRVDRLEALVRSMQADSDLESDSDVR